MTSLFSVHLFKIPWLSIHLVLMSLAFVVFAVSFLVGLLFLFQEFQLKRHYTGRFLNLIPSLEPMYFFYYRFLTAGFVLLTLGILSGAVLSKISTQNFFSEDPKQMASLVTWLLYFILLKIRLKTNWRGRRGIFLSLMGFIALALTFLALKHG